MKIKFEWQVITHGENFHTSRAKVPNGWLIKDLSWWDNDVGTALSESITFISDPNYEWEIE